MKYEYYKITLILERQVVASRIVYKDDKEEKKKKNGVLICDSVQAILPLSNGRRYFISNFFFSFYLDVKHLYYFSKTINIYCSSQLLKGLAIPAFVESKITYLSIYTLTFLHLYILS